MSVALLALLLLSFVAILLNLVAAEWPSIGVMMASYFGTSFISFHFTLGVLAAMLALFSVVITMFYFIGTAKAVKEGVRDYRLDRRYYEMTLKYKRKYFPTMTMALVIYIALPCLGAAVDAEYLSEGFHGLMAYVTLATHGFICYQGWHYIFENDRVVATVDRLIQERDPDTSAAGAPRGGEA